MREGKHGVTASTPKNVLFGAGTIHRNLRYVTVDEYALTKDTVFVEGKTYYTKSGNVYTAATQNVGAEVTASTYYERTVKSGSWNFAESLVGATSGGSKFNISPEVTPIELDGALVAVRGLNKKTGEVAEMQVNFAEFKSDLIATAALAEIVESDVEGFDMIQSKSDIVEGDYWDNIAFVGKLLDGTNVIFIMDNALCTSGLEVDAKNKEQTIPPATFACNADLDGELDKLPWRMYRPTVA